MKRLAIIIPAYKATFLPAALDSIAEQTCKDFKLYIGDDCSPCLWCTAVILVAIGSKYWYTTMHTYEYWIVLPYAITATLAVLTVFHFSQRIAERDDNRVTKFLILTGDHTMEVLTWHFLSLKIVSLLLIFLYGLSINQLSEFPVIEQYARQGWWIAYLIVGVAIPVVWTYYYHLFKDRLTKCSSDFV